MAPISSYEKLEISHTTSMYCVYMHVCVYICVCMYAHMYAYSHKRFYFCRSQPQKTTRGAKLTYLSTIDKLMFEEGNA